MAGVIAFPPLLYGLPLAATIATNYFVTPRRLPKALRFASMGFFIAAASLVAPAFIEMRKAGTSVDVAEETTAVVESGPFEFTRNPIYLGLTLTYIGVSLAARASFPLAALPLVLWMMNTGVIEREEHYLERKFGKAYRRYKNRVPRWL